MLVSHAAKTAVLTMHYANAMGEPSAAAWHLDINELYRDVTGADAT
jgi:hypothetical protein